MTLTDLECLSEIFNDIKQRVSYLWQLSCLLVGISLGYVYMLSIAVMLATTGWDHGRRKPTRPKGVKTMPPPGLQNLTSASCDLDIISWPQKLLVSCRCSVDHCINLQISLSVSQVGLQVYRRRTRLNEWCVSELPAMIKRQHEEHDSKTKSSPWRCTFTASSTPVTSYEWWGCWWRCCWCWRLLQLTVRL